MERLARNPGGGLPETAFRVIQSQRRLEAAACSHKLPHGRRVSVQIEPARSARFQDEERPLSSHVKFMDWSACGGCVVCLCMPC